MVLADADGSIAMIFFLTYHRVSEGADQGRENFYTVSGVQLARQIEMLRARGLECLKMDELLRAATVPENKYILSFDDGTADHYETVLPLLQKYGSQGVFFLPTSKVNKPGYLSDAQVRKMAAAGHVIGIHSHDHRRLDVLPKNEIRQQITLSQNIIADLTGAKPVVFSPPGGFINARIRETAVETGVRVIRTMRWGYNRQPDLLAMETIPLNRYVSEKRFLGILESNNPRFLYAGKEALKRLIPLWGYEAIRRLLFKFTQPK